MENETSRVININVPDNTAGERLDKYLARHEAVTVSRSRIQKLIRDGQVEVDGRPAAHNHPLRGGEKVTIVIPPPPPSEVIAEDIPIEVVYEDEYMLVVDKPAGMVTHPGPGNPRGTLVNALRHYSTRLSGRSGFDRPGIVHRLDKNTSGLIMIAKNDDIHIALQEALKEHRIRKTYLALVCGHMKENRGLIEMPVGRSIKDRKKMTVTELAGRPARTEYELIERFRLHDLLEINLKTGRTHQIRVHFAHIGHPVFGDPEYGGRTKWHRGVFSIDKPFAVSALNLMPRQALHAQKLTLVHPATGKNLAVESELPDDFARLLEFMKTGKP